jgi:hypothetical protein
VKEEVNNKKDNEEKDMIMGSGMIMRKRKLMIRAA